MTKPNTEFHKPVLIPRTLKEDETDRRIEVWHVEGELPGGRVRVVGQQPEEIKGKVDYPGKWVKPEVLSEEAQASYAEELASGRQFNKDVTGRSVSPSKVGGEALVAVDIQTPGNSSELAGSNETAASDLERTLKFMDDIIMNYHVRHEGTPHIMGIRFSVSVDKLRTQDVNSLLDSADIESLAGIVDEWKSTATPYFRDKSISEVSSIINRLRSQLPKK